MYIFYKSNVCNRNQKHTRNYQVISKNQMNTSTAILSMLVIPNHLPQIIKLITNFESVTCTCILKSTKWYRNVRQFWCDLMKINQITCYLFPRYDFLINCAYYMIVKLTMYVCELFGDFKSLICVLITKETRFYWTQQRYWENLFSSTTLA